MNFFVSFLKDITKFLLGIFAPIILIILGGLLIGWALQNDYSILAWTGLVMAGAGVMWGAILVFYYGPINWD